MVRQLQADYNGLYEHRENDLNDLGAVGSGIVALSDQFVHLSHGVFANSNAQLLSPACET